MKIKQRPINQQVYANAIANGLSPLVARVLASRPIPKISIDKLLFPSLGLLDKPSLFKDIDKATDRLAFAIENNEVIGIETDHDCDGQTSCAIIYSCLTEVFGVKSSNIRLYIGHRLQEGYGLSAKLAARILNDEIRPNLIITADNGSQDEPRIADLLANGIETIVTDHHQVAASGPPSSAIAVINPNQAGCDYPDKLIAGCMVAWLFMCAVRRQLVKSKFLRQDASRLSEYLDFVAVGTVADCVSMARSINNRVVVQRGLILLNKAQRNCWKILKANKDNDFNARDLGFIVGPLLNSDGRLSCAKRAVNFLLTKDMTEAQELHAMLQQQNQDRKEIQNRLIYDGITIATAAVEHGSYSLVVYLENGHSGVHGIAASRIKDLFGRPCVFLTKKINDKNLITGSVRGTEEFHVARALSSVAELDSSIFIAHGGHKGAGGLTIHAKKLEQFTKLFESVAKSMLNADEIGPYILTDGKVAIEDIDFDLYESLKVLEPFGREFDEPNFILEGVIEDFRAIGDKTHARVKIKANNKYLSGVWFKFRKTVDEPIIFAEGMSVKVITTIVVNHFRGLAKCELQVLHMECINAQVKGVDLPSLEHLLSP